ncbi:MAG: HAMP domain-containing histidine kinase [Verrucomicrobiae bacterium]|nr:HAMP domain-containing histidine kinase [Verrucomicrobiae bacterium]
MKKLAAVFVLAVLVPAVTLAWLATRSLRDQELVVHGQRALLHQSATDDLAADLNRFLDDVRIFYGELLEQLIAEQGADPLASDFDEMIRQRWSQAEIGAVVSESGEWLNPPLTATGTDTRQFLTDTRPFLMNAAPSEFYLAPATIGNKVVTVDNSSSALRESTRGGPTPKNVEPPEVEMALAPSTRADIAMEEAPAEPSPALKADRVRDNEIAVPATAAPAPAMKAAPADRALPPTPERLVEEAKTASAEQRMIAKGFASPQQKVSVGDSRKELRVEQTFDAQSMGRHSATSEGVPVEAMATAPVQPLEDAETEPAGDNLVRFRNVRPLGQLSPTEDNDNGGFSRFAKAATDALSTNPNRLAWSKLDLTTGQLREKISDAPEGAISRFVSGGLQVLLWRRDPSAPGKVFWVQLDLDELRNDLAEIVHDAAEKPGTEKETSLALLDAAGKVVAQTVPGFTTDWRQPFVATEVGEILPHWEVAAYLLDPEAVARSARSARLLLWMLIPFLLIAIGAGGFLIMRDIGREMRLARQKTDFVSNVSHELKTPLTSIRMFSDLLGNRPDLNETKRLEYSGIISRESARLSRLINNLLDFSRMERGEKRYQMEPIAIRPFIEETLDTCRHQIESDGFHLTVDCPENSGGVPRVIGDRDALAQVMLNLISNAEKYGGDAREIRVELLCDGDSAEVAVLDRGPGISRKQAEKVFEKFYRADDSLASGIEGSGLGLTLARQIARAHGGDLVHQPRSGGGSRFVLSLPLAPPIDP